MKSCRKLSEKISLEAYVFALFLTNTFMTKHLLIEVIIGSSMQINRGQLIGDIFTKSSLKQMHMGQFKQHSHLEVGRLMQIARGTIQQMTLSPKNRGGV